MLIERNDYVVAVSRKSRNIVPKNWIDLISIIDDVEIISTSEYRAVIKATLAAVTQIRKQFERSLIVEEIIHRESL